MNILLKSGFLGRGDFSEYKRFGDGRSDYLLTLLNSLEKIARVDFKKK